LRTQPAAKGQKGGTILRGGAFVRQQSDNLGARAVAVPDHDALILEVEQGFIALGDEIEIGEFGTQFLVFCGNARPFADQPSGRKESGAHDAEEHGKLDDLESAHAAAAEGQGDAGRFRALRKGGHGSKKRCKRNGSLHHGLFRRKPSKRLCNKGSRTPLPASNDCGNIPQNPRCAELWHVVLFSATRP